MCEVTTHIADVDATVCALCAAEIPALSLPLDTAGTRLPIRPGERIGVIRTRTLGARSYRVGANDSNPACVEVGNEL